VNSRSVGDRDCLPPQFSRPLVSPSILEDRRKLDFATELAAFSGWYHSMKFPDGEIIEGYMPLQLLQERYADFGLPEDLHGFRALDIGAWDGWFSFEMERHGALVTAVDVVEVKNFLYGRERLGSKVTYIISDVCDLPELNLAPFDYVLFLGVLYHLRHPLLALETVCSLTTEMAVVDSFVIDGEEREHITTPIPIMEFYETDELGGHLDNWFGPTIDCLLAFCRSAGFARVDHIGTWHRHARVLCHRQWEPEPAAPSCAPPVLRDALNARDYGLNFCSRREEYVALWFSAPAAQLSRKDLRPEIGGFGAQVLSLSPDSGNWLLNTRLPPGLKPGRHSVRVRTGASKFSNECYIFVDCTTAVGDLEIQSLFDGVSWRKNVCATGTGKVATLYVGGTAANTDRNNLQVLIDGIRVRPMFIGALDANELRQVNFQLPEDLPSGKYEVRLVQAGKSSDIAVLKIIP
jgi:tRNA (mo5U34)-methyltransferase